MGDIRRRFAVIVPAAGTATRFGGGDKLACVVGGRSVLARSVAAFATRDDVAFVVVVGHHGRVTLAGSEEYPPGVVRWTAGGATRAESVRLGIAAVVREGEELEFIAVHDAARPNVSQPLIDRVFAVALAEGAAVPGLPLVETVKRVRNGRVAETPPRDELVAVQTPQAMRLDWMLDALHRLPSDVRVTDDVSLLELAGYPVRVVAGEADNIKVTHRSDLSRVATGE